MVSLIKRVSSLCKRSQQRWKIHTGTPCLRTESCPGGRTWCPGRPGCCAPAPVFGCWARSACVQPPLMESCRTFLESEEPLLLQPQHQVRERRRPPMRLTELQLPGVELHVLQGDAGTSGHRQKSSSSSNQQQLHPEADRGRKQQAGEGWHRKL